MEMVHALFRNTKMGSYFNNPSGSPPEFLQHAFPNVEDLRCVCSLPGSLTAVPSLLDLLA